MQNTYYIEYTFQSEINKHNSSRYLTNYIGKVHSNTVANEKDSVIAQFKFTVVHCNLALSTGFDLKDVFKNDAELHQIGLDIYDFDNYLLKYNVATFYDEILPYSDLGIIREITVEPKYRNKTIGKQIISDINYRFSESVALIIAQVIYKPNTINDEELSYYKIKSFYQKLGYKHISGYNNYMFLNPLELYQKLNINQPTIELYESNHCNEPQSCFIYTKPA